MTKQVNVVDATALLEKAYVKGRISLNDTRVVLDYINDPDFVRVPVKLAESFAHLGVDFGHGPYMPSLEEMEELRGLIAASKGESND